MTLYMGIDVAKRFHVDLPLVLWTGSQAKFMSFMVELFIGLRAQIVQRLVRLLQERCILLVLDGFERELRAYAAA